MFKFKTILKLRQIFSMGYVPSRGEQSYSFVNHNDNATFAQHINCFAHACFNLTNEQIEDGLFDYLDRLSFSSHIHNSNCNYIEEEKSFINFVRSSGLEMRPLGADELISHHPQFIADNEWIVAVYYTNARNKKDIHFFLREKDGSWSGKLGFRDEITHFAELPIPYYSHNESNDVYYFHKQYVIRNPHANKIRTREVVIDEKS